MHIVIQETEAAPATGAADVIVDITSTGATLKANGLKIVSDGIILKSEAVLAVSANASWSPAALKSLSLLRGAAKIEKLLTLKNLNSHS